MKRWILSCLLLGLLGVVPAAADVDVEALLKQVRLVAVAQDGELTGQISRGRDKSRAVMFLKGNNIQYQIDTAKGRVIYQLTLNAKDQKLQIRDGGGWKPLPKRRYAEEIGKTKLTYEDLSLRFLYWPKGRIVGEDNIQSVDCYRVLLKNPDGFGSYQSVLLWIGKKNAALMRIEGFDSKNKPIKRFAVAKVMKMGGGYFVKSMRVEPFIQGGRRVGKPSHIEFEKPEKKRVRPQ